MIWQKATLHLVECNKIVEFYTVIHTICSEFKKIWQLDRLRKEFRVLTPFYTHSQIQDFVKGGAGAATIVAGMATPLLPATPSPSNQVAEYAVGWAVGTF